LIGAQYDPALQGKLSGAKAVGTETGKATTEAMVKLPQVVATADQLTNSIDQMIGSPDGKVKPHPGMGTYLGTAGAAGYIPKTDAASFKARLDQLQGGTFLQAYNSLRGGGQITEIEGAKAETALNRAKAAQTNEEFIAALREFQGVIKNGSERARMAAQGNFNATSGSDNDPLGLRK